MGIMYFIIGFVMGTVVGHTIAYILSLTDKRRPEEDK